jgi:putative ABC transport system substrate-binding protein
MRLSAIFFALLVVTLLVPLCAADAQQPTKIPLIGYVSTGAPRPTSEAFRQGLRDLGYVEGKNIIIEWRFSRRQADRLPGFIASLIGLPVDILVTNTTRLTVLAKKATKTIPIVMTTVGDPIGSGVIASLARPGGNVTGMTTLQSDLGGKRLQVLKEAVLGISRIAVMWKPKSHTSASNFPDTERAARALGLEIMSLEMRGPDDFDGAFRAAAQGRVDAVAVLSDGQMFANRTRFLRLAAEHRLTTMHTHGLWVKAGALISYGTDFTDVSRRAATYIDKILKGANPATLPVQQPTKFELVVNLGTAKTLGITIPNSILLRADKVIE